MVDVTAAPPSGKPHGKIDIYEFPDSARMGENKKWALSVHNDGDAAGVIFGGIANMPGNPGNLIITHQGEEVVVEPGYFWYFYASREVCSYVGTSGLVRFTKEGSYVVRLLGGHIIGDKIYVDDQIDLDG